VSLPEEMSSDNLESTNAHGGYVVAPAEEMRADDLEHAPASGRQPPHKCIENLEVGTLVALTGLRKDMYNQHVGRVVVASTQGGRVGVRLDGAIWEDDVQGSSKSKRQTNDISIAVRVENIRLCRSPLRQDITVSGTRGANELSLLLGKWQDRSLSCELSSRIVSWLLISPVQDSDVRVSGCSSQRGDFPLSAVLERDESTWWISAPGTMSSGEGSEHLEFSFGVLPRRISYFGIRIPPMPFGPLSVRVFHILALDEVSNSWVAASPQLLTLNNSSLQEFSLSPPIEASKLRVVCVRNAAADTEFSFSTDCIGLFQVRFA